MQFHLNGFRAGDPHIVEAAPGVDDGPVDDVDVLIVGCGPAGLTLAAQLAVFADIRTRIVEQKSGALQLGQADGIACRTMEMFEAFGFSERVMREAYWVNETTFWTPDEARPEHIRRAGRIQDVEDGLSEFPHVILNQARVHDMYLDLMRNSPRRLVPDYSRRFRDLTVTPREAGPVTVTLERCEDGHQGELETIRARYVVGCDGARSAVREAIGRKLKGDSANQAWGVMDVLAVTDFPDIRFKTVIRSATEGNIIIIPREGGYLVRFYIELDRLSESERISNRNITVDHLIAAARRILCPHTLEVKEVVWWSVYEIGQRLCDHFDDVANRDAAGRDVGDQGAEEDRADRTPRVFIAGDACHTHSPKAGLGMNVSMGDAFNLGWKLALVLRDEAPASLLHSYTEERQAVAEELIEFDRHWSRRFSERPNTGLAGNDGALGSAEFQDYFTQHGRFTAGTAVRYVTSSIQGPPTHQHLASGLLLGMRLHSAPVIRLADARPMELGAAIRADGRWRLFAFAGRDDDGSGDSRVRALCGFLAGSPESPLLRHTPAGADVDALIDVRAVFQQPHRTLSVQDMPGLLFPAKGQLGLIDQEKVFTADAGHKPDIFDLRGIDRESGCVVVVRPDQHVAHVLPLQAHADLSAFFAGFLKVRLASQ